ncbi:MULTISPECIES: DUF3320 domain-containing protein [unclassified Undibacterium]|uniref:DUF3320 domain-containing protein n=3 Tax=Pseudomonadota TaxID=1224 RepID=UPI002AC8DC57|nr:MULTISPECIES: DUF3320 domain-containing protein [unclassified Undibacterium]MEB0137864.1 DUF3320 domain-containing protein [Undibacterium sp. CCC2.1]MEB0170945.1 DUF3320 domain-containing protein [Undibacterium sp. CCC1.1]MEB0174990.1 DUF3320 domain-containing protein [Undibacterium sp. CCC3.4]MEB0215804.1 DUF3320 domain-containing protein [Undibacterium sp. 5I2]WPX44796.1 DUF3320 domain-containing protein [Undibacterium sp. CCC3.4]
MSGDIGSESVAKVVLPGETKNTAEVFIEATLIKKLNLADYQNAVPLLRELLIVNDTLFPLNELTLTITSEPAFIKTKSWRLDAINESQQYRIPNLDVELEGVLLVRLTEAEIAHVTFTLNKTGSAEIICQHQVEVELLPRNQWGGISHLPDMVAAFVQPNEPAIERLLKQTAEVLHHNGKNRALNGYNGGAKRAWELASAIWTAVAGMGIDYALPPASFEHKGQKIRGSGQIAESGLGTCLDLSLLFCSALEQCGLNPILVFTQGHAFAGVWLKNEEFSTVVVDDITALRKRVKLKELVLFETTLLTHRPCPTFSHAIEVGTQQISEEVEQCFELSVDIRRARLQRIKPLSSAELPKISEVINPSEKDQSTFEEAPDLPDDPETDGEREDKGQAENRLIRWQRKLLDLSMRNNLLNFHPGKKAIRLDAPDPGLLEDLLAEGHSLKLMPRPALMDGNDPRDQVIHEARTREDVRREHALDALKRKEIFVSIEDAELESRLVELYRTSRTNLQEGGSNTLYLALGFLSWTRENKDDKTLRAPLILVPVTLNRKSVRSGFTLTLHDDEPCFNPTLIEMLRQDYELSLSIGEGELPKDKSGLDVSKIWNTVSAAIKNIKGWEVVEDVVLSTFSFAKYLMWKDLTERTEQLKQNAVVRHLIDTPRESYPRGVPFPNPRYLDREYPPQQTFCPLPADSSQLSAVMAASRGKDFVLIGPPGTGKSQTIANLIAQCLAENKRVLFVSEKIAALDVVYRRLRDVGLGDFCLEMHSSKAKKLDVLNQLKKSWDAKGNSNADVWKEEASRLQLLRECLNAYVERLHHRHRNGLSPYDAMGRIGAGRDVAVLGMSWPSADAHDVASLNELLELAERLDVNAKEIGSNLLMQHPLGQIAHSDWSPNWQQTLIDVARKTIPKADALQSSADAFCTTIGFSSLGLTKNARHALAVLSTLFSAAAGRDWRFALHSDARRLVSSMQVALKLVASHRSITDNLSAPWSTQTIAGVNKGLQLLEKTSILKSQLSTTWSKSVVDNLTAGICLLASYSETKLKLSVSYRDDATELDADQLQRDWAAAEASFWPTSWLRKRAIQQTMLAYVSKGQKPQFTSDIKCLIELQSLRVKLAKFDSLSLSTDQIWSGLKTQQDDLKAALAFQTVLDCAHKNVTWEDQGFDSIDEGRCGGTMRTDLMRARDLVHINNEFTPLAALTSLSQSMWLGHETHIDTCNTGLRFQEALIQAKAGRTWLKTNLNAVADGSCGSEMLLDLNNMNALLDIEYELASYDELRAATHGVWNGLKSQPEEIDSATKFHASLASVLSDLASTPDELVTIKAALNRLLGDGNDLLAPAGPVSLAGGNYVAAHQSLLQSTDSLGQLSGISQETPSSFQLLTPARLVMACQDMIAAEPRLRAWCAWRKVRDEASLVGMGVIAEAIENGGVLPGLVREAFETNYCRWWLNAVVDDDNVLRNFVSVEHEKRIKNFQELDDRFTELTQAWVRARLCAELPDQEAVERNSEWGVLRHEMQKKARHLPLRELVGRVSSAMAQLTPCMLMSPLSIAQYLSADSALFDLVVFDEASQITVWDAIGAIARGKQTVMVGDPKQLPPTNFFDRAESDLDDEDVEGDLESILDECLGANLPTIDLSWHYRSRSESLIAFSNHRYYGGSLVTFPSPVTDDRAVNFHYIPNGIYEKGGARINKPEAKALVKDITARLKQPGFRESGLTIGVVTFNTEQQRLIEDLLDDERRKDPSIEPYFSETALEPVFVKNLESVQGDERDIMYFSITYGPTLSGTVSMNFGPMNKQGGERRLNVAITRARHELRVFSSLRPEQMDLSRTQAEGVRDLKHFLLFAERGPKALAEANSGSVGGYESPFEKSVALALAARGWRVEPQIGVSAFRIDLGIVDPDAPGSYLAGIECDGATYHRSATAKDRDKLREQVLRGLGWEIVRIWSTDWWIDPVVTLEKVNIRLEHLLTVCRARRLTEADRVEKLNLAAAIVAENSLAATLELSTDFSHLETKTSEFNTATAVSDEILAVPAINVAAVQPPAAARVLFIEADIRVEGTAVTAEVFFEKNYEVTLIQMIKDVVAVEGPIKDEVLSRRIARAHGWQRTGARIHERVTSLAAHHLHSTQEETDVFFWHSTEQKNTIVFRRPDMDVTRSVDEIALPELVALAHELSSSEMTGEDTVLAMAREIGLSKLRATSRLRLEVACLEAQQSRGMSTALIDTL